MISATQHLFKRERSSTALQEILISLPFLLIIVALFSFVRQIKMPAGSNEFWQDKAKMLTRDKDW